MTTKHSWGAIALCITGSTVLAGTVFTDRAMFEAALSGTAIETFEDSPLVGTTDDGGVAMIAFDDFSVSTVPNAAKVIDVPFFGAANTTPGGSQYLYLDTDVGGVGSEATFAFNAAQSAFGFDFTDIDQAVGDVSVTIAGDSFTVPNAASQDGFWGFIADPGEAFSSAVLTSESDSGYGIDQVTFVPTPSGMAMLAALSLVSVRRRGR
ncbi:MAG: hypothetical protein AAGK04_02290 [Planctomycetota bacterium]